MFASGKRSLDDKKTLEELGFQVDFIILSLFFFFGYKINKFLISDWRFSRFGNTHLRKFLGALKRKMAHFYSYLLLKGFFLFFTSDFNENLLRPPSKTLHLSI